MPKPGSDLKQETAHKQQRRSLLAVTMVTSGTDSNDYWPASQLPTLGSVCREVFCGQPGDKPKPT